MCMHQVLNLRWIMHFLKLPRRDEVFRAKQKWLLEKGTGEIGQHLKVLDGLSPERDRRTAEEKLRPVMNELAYNLESFNPAFTAVLLKVKSRSCSSPLFLPKHISCKRLGKDLLL